MRLPQWPGVLDIKGIEMSTDLIQDIKKHIGATSTEDLLDIWIENDRQKWSAEYFEAVRLTLLERNETVPSHSQRKPPQEPDRLSANKKRQGLAIVFLLSGAGIYLFISLFNYMVVDLLWPTSPIMEILRHIRNALTLLCIFIAALLYAWPYILKER
jgi:hypothetical protein